MSNDLQKVTENTDVARFKEQLEIAKQYVEVIKNSNYGKLFEVRVPDENGLKDTEGNFTQTKVVIRDEDIISCILLGRELGLSDMVSVTFGKTLDRTAYFKVMKGKSLGLDPITSLQRIFAYEKDGQMIIGTDSSAISSVTIKAGITFEIITDFKRKLYYRDAKTKAFLGYDFDESWVVANRGIGATKLQEALTSGKYAVLEDFTFYSESIFHRKGFNDHKESYSLLEATEAGLYKGLKFDGTEEKGKFAWNANPKRILTTRLIAIGQSRLGSDILNGVYTNEEILEIKSNDLGKDITDAEIIK